MPVTMKVHPSQYQQIRPTLSKDGSVSSTVEVSPCYTKQHHPEPRKESVPSRRFVRFDETANVTFLQQDAGLWYDSTDLERFERDHLQDCKDCILLDNRPENKGMTAAVERVYDALCTVEAAPNGLDAPLSSAITSKDAQMFAAWASSPSRRGIECSTHRTLREDRTVRKEEILWTVTGIQDECRDMDAPERAEMIRQEACSISQTSRLFARYLAQVQWESADDGL